MRELQFNVWFSEGNKAPQSHQVTIPLNDNQVTLTQAELVNAINLIDDESLSRCFGVTKTIYLNGNMFEISESNPFSINLLESSDILFSEPNKISLVGRLDPQDCMTLHPYPRNKDDISMTDIGLALGLTLAICFGLFWIVAAIMLITVAAFTGVMIMSLSTVSITFASIVAAGLVIAGVSVVAAKLTDNSVQEDIKKSEEDISGSCLGTPKALSNVALLSELFGFGGQRF